MLEKYYRIRNFKTYLVSPSAKTVLENCLCFARNFNLYILIYDYILNIEYGVFPDCITQLCQCALCAKMKLKYSLKSEEITNVKKLQVDMKLYML